MDEMIEETTNLRHHWFLEKGILRIFQTALDLLSIP